MKRMIFGAAAGLAASPALAHGTPAPHVHAETPAMALVVAAMAVCGAAWLAFNRR